MKSFDCPRLGEVKLWWKTSFYRHVKSHPQIALKQYNGIIAKYKFVMTDNIRSASVKGSQQKDQEKAVGKYQTPKKKIYAYPPSPLWQN